jgi:hypothetical protein
MKKLLIIFILIGCSSNRNLAVQRFNISSRLMECDCLSLLQDLRIEKRKNYISISSKEHMNSYYKVRVVDTNLSVEYLRGNMTKGEVLSLAKCFNGLKVSISSPMPSLGLLLFYKGEDQVWIYISDSFKLPSKELEWFDANYIRLNSKWYYARVKEYNSVLSPKIIEKRTSN